jgi:hypothetical protein
MGQLLLSDGDNTLDYTRRALNAAGRALAVDPTNGANPVAAKSAADNADMAAFTFLLWIEGSLGSHKEVNDGGMTYLERVATFTAVACNSNID